MPAEMRSVFSSVIDQIGYDEETQELTVVWKKGRTSVYSGVPEQVARGVISAPSVGSAVHEQIKANYAHRYQ